MIKDDMNVDQLQIDEDMRVKLQSSSSTYLVFRCAEEILRLGGKIQQ